jgi:para-aminobenzoate synthetase component II
MSPSVVGPPGGPRVLVVDNHDSFVFNIVHYLAELGARCVVKVREQVSATADVVGVDGILLSPGPGHPAGSGVCLDLVRGAASHGRPILGVCLGHQVIAVASGGRVGPAPEVVHGYTSAIRHDGTGVLAGLPDPFAATRYHSLAVDPESVPGTLHVTATTSDGVIMGLRHRRLPVEGVQFHPESVLSRGGHQLLGTWLAGLRRPFHPAGVPVKAVENID